jgi:hypothetical protein
VGVDRQAGRSNNGNTEYIFFPVLWGNSGRASVVPSRKLAIPFFPVKPEAGPARLETQPFAFKSLALTCGS